MSTEDNTGGKKTVSFENQNAMDNNIDKCTAIISKLATHSNDQDKPLKAKIYQVKRSTQGGNNYYDGGRQ